MPGYWSPVHTSLDKMPHCLHILLCCVTQLHSYALHADADADADVDADDDIPGHIKRYVDRR